jgi:hypothetical protein
MDQRARRTAPRDADLAGTVAALERRRTADIDG